MLKLFFSVFLFSLLTTSATAQRGEGHDVDNPGDMLRFRFSEAKKQAAGRVLKVTEADLNSAGVAADISSWLLNNINMLASDIIVSQHVWTTQHTGSCAATNRLPTKSDIHLSYPACGNLETGVRGDDDAMRLLIHEGVHHFGFDATIEPQKTLDEKFCDDVADAVLRSYEVYLKRVETRWTPTSTTKAPVMRAFHGSAWTGSKMLVWGGCRETDSSIAGCGQYLADGGLYNPVEKKWTEIPTATSIIDRRAYHSVVWTGEQNKKVIVWGGCRAQQAADQACNFSFNDGAIFDLQTNRFIESIKAPIDARVFHSAVWTGSEILVWGGVKNYKTRDTVPLGDGAHFNLSSKSWKTIQPSAESPSPRREHTAIWTGPTNDLRSSNKMVIWGGCQAEIGYFCNQVFQDGSIYNPATASWKKMNIDNAPSPRRAHTAVWTGDKMIVWGGQDKNGYLNNGGVYDVANDEWTELNYLAPTARAWHTAVWTGSHMIIWGGQSGIENFPTDFGVYSPQSDGNDFWKQVISQFGPQPRRGHSAIWTGTAALQWGGMGLNFLAQNTGGLFFPGEE